MQAKILIVYDKSETSLLLRKLLEPAGYETVTAGSGRRAVEMCERDQPDLVLLAATTRDIEGLEVCRRLKKEQSTAHIPIVMYSGKREASYRMQAYGAGVDDTLLEPFEKIEVQAKVAAHLKRLSGERTTSHLAVLHETNATKDRLLWLFSRVNHLLSDVLTTRGYRETIAMALGSAAEITGSDWAALAVYDPRRGSLNYDNFFGINPVPKPFSISLPKSAATELFARRMPVVVNDYAAKGTVGLFKSSGAQAFAGVPLGSFGELLGLLSVFRIEANAYKEGEEEQLIALAPVFAATLLKSGNEARISQMATLDSLTGLLSWHFGIKALQKAITQAESDKKTFSAVRIDLDNLRNLNEVHGFSAGDAILKQVGAMIQKSLVPGQAASRSGKKFLLILPGQPLETAELLAKTIVIALQTLKMQYKGNDVACRVSAGWIVHEAGELLHAFYGRLEQSARRGESRNDPGARAELTREELGGV